MKTLKSFKPFNSLKKKNALTLVKSGFLGLPENLVRDLLQIDSVEACAQIFWNEGSSEVAIKFVPAAEATEGSMSIRGNKINLQKLVNQMGIKIDEALEIDFDQNAEERAIFFKLQN